MRRMVKLLLRKIESQMGNAPTLAAMRHSSQSSNTPTEICSAYIRTSRTISMRGCGYWKAAGTGFCDFLGMGTAATERSCEAFFSRKG